MAYRKFASHDLVDEAFASERGRCMVLRDSGLEAFMPHTARRIPAYYSASICEFCSATPNAVLGQLASAGIDLEETQKNAYLEEIGILQTLLETRQGTIYLEFAVPRLASRIDAVVIIDSALFVMEFKCGADRFHRGDINQTWDYGLDLKNFHAGSHAADIFPVLVATKATHSDQAWQPTHADGVRPPACSGVYGLADLIDNALASRGVGSIDARGWESGDSIFNSREAGVDSGRKRNIAVLGEDFVGLCSWALFQVYD